MMCCGGTARARGKAAPSRPHEEDRPHQTSRDRAGSRIRGPLARRVAGIAGTARGPSSACRRCDERESQLLSGEPSGLTVCAIWPHIPSYRPLVRVAAADRPNKCQGACRNSCFIGIIEEELVLLPPKNWPRRRTREHSPVVSRSHQSQSNGRTPMAADRRLMTADCRAKRAELTATAALHLFLFATGFPGSGLLRAALP